jgi:hypothetical protein
MKKIIIINGAAGVGKDTFITFCHTHAYHKHPIWNLSTIDAVKEIARAMFGWNGEKTESARRLLSDLKDAWTSFNDGPFKQLTSRIYTISKGLIFVHVREPAEILKFKNYYRDNCLTLLIRRSGLDVPNNNADRNVEKYMYELTIDNNAGLPALESAAKRFLNELGVAC